MSEADFMQLAIARIIPKIKISRQLLDNKTGRSPQAIRAELSARMSAHAAHIRHAAAIRSVKDYAATQLQQITENTFLSCSDDLLVVFENIDLLITQYVYAAAMENYIITGGGSRGSYIIPDINGIYEMPDLCKFSPDNGKLSSKIQEVSYTSHGCAFKWDDVRPIPQDDNRFENVWRAYREDEVIR
jgi:hypothetical protein